MDTSMTNPKAVPGPSTRAVHAGASSTHAHNAIVQPVVQSATYTFADTQDLTAHQQATLLGQAGDRVDYGRYGNATVMEVERRLAALEGSAECVLFASGMAAVTTTLLALLGAGAHMLITDDSYRRTRQFCLTFLNRYGVETSVVAAADVGALAAAIRPNTRMLVSESPTNPYLRCLDLDAFAALGRKHNIYTLIDATFATPLNCRPLEHGVDLVIHSATKYLGGHNDLLAGALCASAQLTGLVRQLQFLLGGVLDPQQAFLLGRGLKTLALRVERQNENGQRVAEFLATHPAVERVWYPGLPSHPDHNTARAQMRGFGGVVSFEVRGDLAAASRVVDRVKIPLIAPSLGGVESLIEQPALMSFFELDTAERLAVGIKDNLIRLALGIEDPADLIADLQQALANN